jgi:hypothetical protein
MEEQIVLSPRAPVNEGLKQFSPLQALHNFVAAPRYCCYTQPRPFVIQEQRNSCISV